MASVVPERQAQMSFWSDGWATRQTLLVRVQLCVVWWATKGQHASLAPPQPSTAVTSRRVNCCRPVPLHLPFACPTGYLSISMVPSQLVSTPTQQKRTWSPWLSGKATSCNCCRSLPRRHGLEFEGATFANETNMFCSSRKSVTRDLKRAKILDFVIQVLQLVVSDVRRALKRISSLFLGCLFVCSWWDLQPSPRPFLLLYTTFPQINLALFCLFGMQLFQNFSFPYGVHVVYSIKLQQRMQI